MRRFRSPSPNRHGKHEIHDVIPRKEAWYRARGWTEIESEASSNSIDSVDTSGPWLKARKRIMDDTGLDLPKTKAEAIDTLKAAGYEVR